MTPKKPAKRPPLTFERIVSAAAELIDREGPDAISARRLAAELGCEAMSLYHHVSTMQEVLDGVVDQMLAGLPRVDAALSPRARLAAIARDFLELARQRPHTFRVIGTRRWRIPAELTFQSTLVDALIESGLPSRRALCAARVLLVYLNGAGLAIAGWTLDRGPPALGAAPAALKQLMERSDSASIAKDMQWGTEALLNALVPGADALQAKSR
jgi:AcrR family transcriptional regulator